MIYLFLAINCASLYYVMFFIEHEEKKNIWQLLCCCIFQFILFFLNHNNRLLLVVFYCIIYLLKLLMFQFINGNHRYNIIMANINFIYLAACHIMSIALIALFFNVDMSTVIETPQFKPVCYILFLFMDALGNIFIGTKYGKFRKLFSDISHQKYRDFEYFLWFCNIFLLVQSVLSQKDHFPTYTSFFLICNELLLLTLLFCFIRNIHEINEQAYVEIENEQLQNESDLRRKNMEDIKKYADIDILTNAHSRKFTMQYIGAFIQNSTPFSIAFIDLDKLKSINDIYGHSAGDQYLRSFAESIEIFLHEGDILGRIGGDEFLLVLKNMKQADAQKRMEYIHDKIRNTAHLQTPYFSYGVVTYDAAKHDIETLVKEADTKMYQQKAEHRKG